jgi:hypothetical protein
MKKSILLFIIMLGYLYSFAQQKVHFPDSNFYWNEFESQHYPNPDPTQRYDDYDIGTMYLDSDTIVDGKRYLKLYYKFTREHYEYPPPIWLQTLEYRESSLGLFGLLLNDTANQKVYIRESGKDILLYDFNLKVNDTFPQTYFKDNWISTVRKIDFIIDNNNVKRKRWTVLQSNLDTSMGMPYSYLIEGLGVSSGIYGIRRFLKCFEYCSDQTECYSINDSLTYIQSDFGTSCDFHQFVGIANQKKINLSISPNPAVNYFDVKISSIKNIKLYNSLQSVDIPYQILNEYVRFDCSHLKNGMYYLTIYDQEETYSGRVMIMR